MSNKMTVEDALELAAEVMDWYTIVRPHNSESPRIAQAADVLRNGTERVEKSMMGAAMTMRCTWTEHTELQPVTVCSESVFEKVGELP